jgi:hypothetical protein
MAVACCLESNLQLGCLYIPLKLFFTFLVMLQLNNHFISFLKLAFELLQDLILVQQLGRERLNLSSFVIGLILNSFQLLS